MSAVKEGKGLATIEDITVACLGIFLERHDTSGGIIERRGKQEGRPSKGVWEGGLRDVRFFGANERRRRKKGK